MFTLTATEIARICAGRLLCGAQATSTGPAVIDSRQACPGALFAAFSGTSVDGHDYVEAACAAGATVVLITDAERAEELCARVCHQKGNGSSGSDAAALILVTDMQAALWDLAREVRARLDCPVIAITGSSGKTSTKELLVSVLSCTRRTVATYANHNNELGVPLTLLQADARTQALVVELGMRAAGEIAALAALVRPQIGIITSIGLAHVERLGSPEAIAAAKAELLSALPPEGLALYPDDTGYTDLLRAATTSQRALTVGFEPGADYVATEVTIDDQGCASAIVRTPRFTLPVTLQVPGRHLLSDALLVIACAQELGIPDDVTREGLSRAGVVGSRGARLEVPQRQIAIIADTYNANPESMAAALRTLATLQPGQPGGRRVAVLGDMLELGEAAPDAHRGVLDLARELGLEYLFVFGSQFGAAATPEIAYDDMVVLAQTLCCFVQPGDIILVKGSRGMRMERIIEALQNKN